MEPENRRVARELERQWEQKLLEQHPLEDPYDRFRQDQSTALTDADRKLIPALSADIPKRWHAPETSSADRQTIVRHLIRQVAVTAPADSQPLDLDLHWVGGFTRPHTLLRPVARYEQLDNYPQRLARVLELRDPKPTSARIAEPLNREGFRPPKRRETFNRARVRALLSRRGRTGKRPNAMAAHTLGTDEWWFTDLARPLDLPNPTLYRWRRRGWVHARQLPVAGGRWIVWADAGELDRLRRLRHCPRSWHNQPQAAELTKPRPRPALS